ncbi:MAG TPA: DUF2281 domain-containing protein [Longimicrobium sp.]|nr:DUF2281 domain-containing protein [Longimicrobium sp.]
MTEAQGRLAELVAEAAAGRDVVIEAEDGTAARLVSAAIRGTPRFGSAKGMFTIADDFDAPLDDLRPYEQ